MKKIIKINSEKDYNKFLKSIMYYKSFIFNSVEFKLESKYKNEFTEILIKGLNIKNKNKRTEYIYDSLCEMFDQKMDLNICKFINDRCIVQRNKNSKAKNGCCANCKHQLNRSCNTKNLTCKLFYCPTIKRKYKVIKMKEIPLFKLFSLKQRLLLRIEYFSSREEILKDLNSFGLIFKVFRITKR